MSTDPLALAAQLAESTTRLLATAGRLTTSADLAAPSLLPGWTRGHVLTHLARNADALGNLLAWAHTGVVTPAYPSRAARNEAIEAGAGRPPAEQLADLTAASQRFATAAEQLSPAGWLVTVELSGGGRAPAARVMWSRWREVEVHHVDLAAGYRPADWPVPFAQHLLHEVVTGLSGVDLTLQPTDAAHPLTLGTGGPAVSGSTASLAAWLTGRSAGADLTVTPAGDLPALPDWI